MKNIAFILDPDSYWIEVGLKMTGVSLPLLIILFTGGSERRFEVVDNQYFEVTPPLRRLICMLLI